VALECNMTQVSGQLEVRLLGRPAFHANGAWSDLKPGLTAALLGYLAYERRWVERGELAALFWPDHREAAARGNLRPLLWRLANEPMPITIERERSRVRWPVRTDHQAFVDACQAQRWRAAWELFQGELLAGVRVPAAPEFETWLEIERGSLKSAHRTVAMRLAEDAMRAGDVEMAAEVLSDQYRLDAFDESVLRALADALDRRGSRAEALATLASFERLCREDLGAEPEPETRALAAAIRAGRREGTHGSRSGAHQRARSSGPYHQATTVPVPQTPFVGRRNLVADVARTVVDASCRVVTLVGPGGVGKTRIAIEVARLVADRFEAGACFVELAAVSNEGAFIAAIAAATGIDVPAGDDPKREVMRTLAPQRMLLVLDNLEHLHEAPALVAELVRRAPRVTVLVTSRQVSGLVAECVIDVAGLAHRDVARPGGRDRDGDATAAAVPTESATLFAQAARRAGAGLKTAQQAGAALQPADAAAIERLCARLGGVPLAIEFAAAWTRVLSLDEIEVELAGGLDILSVAAPARAARHASMRQVFEHSWAALHPRERAAMRRLAPFRGGFTLAAAREAADVELPVLLALTNKSFLRRSGDGRFSRHALVWHFARERAEEHPAELETARDRHAAYYLGFLAERRVAFRDAEGERMMLEIRADLENVAAAWRWACQREQRSLLRSAVTSLGRFCWAWGRYDLQDELLSPALEASADDRVLRGLVLVQQGSAQAYRALGDHGASLYEQAIPLLEAAAGPAEVAWALHVHVIACARLGRLDAAVASATRAAELYRAVGDVDGALVNTIAQGAVADTVGAALDHYDRCIDAAHVAGASHPMAVALVGRAGMLVLLGDFAAAEAAVRAAQRVHRGMRAPFWSLDRRNLRSLVCIDRGRLRVARALCCRTLAGRGRSSGEVEALGDPGTVAMGVLALVDYLVDDHVAAVRWARRSLDHHRQRHGPAASHDLAAYVLARAALSTGDAAGATRWLDEVGRGPEPRWYSLPFRNAALTMAATVCRAEIAMASDDDAAAASELRSAIERARRMQLLSPGLAALVAVSRLRDRRGETDRARRLATLLQQHPRATFETRRAASRLPGSDDASPPDGSPESVLGLLDEALGEL
jgi:predicted ATPase/DNA-binding SARP family transcriptional activator